ncbi:hypothetical protein HDU98_003188 [Podochytrium sp. JEL0797]|nr:hypothetical protein HDU98_003188 [Podochytrium sp. JEL0797]
MSSAEDFHGDQTKEQPQEGKVVCGIRWTKKLILIILVALVVIIVALALIVVFVVAPHIAQSSIDGSQITLTNSSITNAQESAFALSSAGTVSGAGSMAAVLNFPEPVQISWTNREGGAADLPLGSVSLSSISTSSSGTGDVTLSSTFNISSTDNMAAFSTYMIHGANFSWRMSGNAEAKALGLTIKGLSINKVVTLAGFNGLSQISVKGFDASHGDGDNVNTTVTSDLTNPSQITMDMGKMFFDFTLGTGKGQMQSKDVVLAPGSNIIQMTGIIAPVNGTTINAKVQSLLVNAVNNVVPVALTGNHVVSSSGQTISWLNTAFKTVSLSINMNLTSIAQDSITQSALNLNSTGINQVQENSFHLVGTGAATQAGYMDATLSFPAPVTVSWTKRADGAADLVLGTMQLAPVSVSGVYPKSGSIAVDTVFNISSTDNMALFSASMINSPSFSWKLDGIASAEAYGLTFTNLKLSKVIDQAGFNGLTNVSIVSFDLPSSDPAVGIRIVTSSSISNPSAISMDMGDVVFNLFAQDMTPIGSLASTAVKMAPGANVIPMTGAMRVADSEKLSVLMNTFLLSGEGLNTIITGNSSSLASTWLNRSLQQLKISLTVPSPKLTGPIVSKLTIPSMAVSMNPSDKTGMSVSLSAPVITALFTLPYAFPVDVKSVQQTLQFIDIQTNVAFATLTTAMGAASADQTSRILTTAVSGGSLVAIPGKEDMFAHFMAALTFVDTASVNITGSAVSKISTAAGDAQIALPLTDILPLQGFQGFQNVQVVSTKVMGGDKNGVHLEVQIILNNPSTLSLSTNVDVTMGLQVGGVSVGSAVMPNMMVVPGPNPITTTVVMAYGADATSQMVLRHLMSGFIAGGSVQSTIVGTADSIVYDSLKPAFSKLSIPATITGPQNAVMVVSSTLTPGDAVVGRPSMNVFTIANPLDAPYTLLHIKATVTAQTPRGLIVIGSIDYELKTPVTVAPHGQANTEPVPLLQTPQQYETSVGLVMMLLASGHDSLLVNANQTLTAAIGTYPVMLDYQANNVPVHIVTPITLTTLPSQVMCTGSKLTLGSPNTNVFTLANPLPAPYTLLAIKATVTVVTPKGVVTLGTIDYTLKTPVTVMPNQFATTEPVPMIQTTDQLVAAANMVGALAGAHQNTFLVNADQTLSAMIGTFPASVHYPAVGIPVTVVGL